MARRIAFLGPVGTFSEQAALAYAPTEELVPFPTIPAAARAVASGAVDEAVVPIENSLEGPVTYTLDILIQEDRTFINSELVIPIVHCLLARPGTRTEDVRTVYSHPQALGQCRGFLERVLPDAEVVASLSTVAAVEDLKGSPGPAAAISPRRAADLHSMEILAEGIQDGPSNATRFVVLSPSDHAPTGMDKTSLCFSFDQDSPGRLHGVLGEFADRGINLAKIESRPTKQSLGEYIFLVDCEGHREDPSVRAAIDAVRRQTSMLKIFGSYPRWQAE